MGFINCGRPLLIAHRGGGALYPENTIYAFEKAVAIYEADVIELDIHTTRDGEIVVIHDPTVDRTTNGTGMVRDFTLEELKRLDAGYKFTKDGGRTYPFRGRGITIPTLREVFERFKETPIIIEIKERSSYIEKKLYNIIVNMGLKRNVLVNSQYVYVMNRFHRVNEQGVYTGADVIEALKIYILACLNLGLLYRKRVDAFQVPESYSILTIVTDRTVKFCHGKGIMVHVWTINEKQDMYRLLNMGVDGVVTDYPDRLLEVMKDMGFK